MNGIARISFSGGERLMPARNGYDRELVFDEAECLRPAARRGAARAQLDRDADPPARAPIGACAQCQRPIDRIDFALGKQHLCRRCVRLSAR